MARIRASKNLHVRGPRASAPGSDAKREKLIEAAGRVFAERGYYSATVREICRRAGANVAAINYHFGDKLGLYTAVLEESVRAARLDAMKNAFDSNAPPEETLAAVIRARLESAARRSLADWQLGIMAHEFARPTPALSQIVETVSRPLFGRLLELIGRILELPPDDDETQRCAYSILAQILFYVLGSSVLAQLRPQGLLTPSQVGPIADHVTRFSLAYLRESTLRRKQNAGAQPSRTPS
jgi:TetR/AcrR family transcriptional regulator, regulator of cefoperazone and chloramphenicol sensitivity